MPKLWVGSEFALGEILNLPLAKLLAKATGSPRSFAMHKLKLVSWVHCSFETAKQLHINLLERGKGLYTSSFKRWRNLDLILPLSQCGVDLEGAGGVNAGPWTQLHSITNPLWAGLLPQHWGLRVRSLSLPALRRGTTTCELESINRGVSQKNRGIHGA